MVALGVRCWGRERCGFLGARVEQSPGMSHHVFISHSSQDDRAAAAACQALEAGGIRCWIAPRDVPPGAEWPDAVAQALEECRAFVLVFSRQGNASRQVLSEVTRAVERQIPVLPFCIEKELPSGGMAH